MVNNIKNNTISGISAKKGLNTLSKLKNAGIIKYKKRTPGQKELLDLFNDLLHTNLTNKTLESESQKDENENENDKTLMSSKDENENENDETLMSSKDENKNENDNENEDDDEIMSLDKKNKKIKYLNDLLDEIIKLKDK